MRKKANRSKTSGNTKGEKQAEFKRLANSSQRIKKNTGTRKYFT